MSHHESCSLQNFWEVCYEIRRGGPQSSAPFRFLYPWVRGSRRFIYSSPTLRKLVGNRGRGWLEARLVKWYQEMWVCQPWPRCSSPMRTWRSSGQQYWSLTCLHRNIQALLSLMRLHGLSISWQATCRNRRCGGGLAQPLQSQAPNTCSIPHSLICTAWADDWDGQNLSVISLLKPTSFTIITYSLPSFFWLNIWIMYFRIYIYILSQIIYTIHNIACNTHT